MITSVICSGCFDILHAGHIRLLEEARKLGDTLTVLVNDDAYLKRKGPCRPIVPLVDRMAVLQALRAVDHVYSFACDNPCHLLYTLQPNIYVKGSEYAGKNIPEEATMRDIGGKVVYIDSNILTHSGHIIDRIERIIEAQHEQKERQG